MLIRHTENYKWDNIPVLTYKEDTNCFKSITRQVLLDGVPELPCQLRYFVDCSRWIFYLRAA